MIALLAAALLAPGATELSLTAGSLFALRAARGLGPVEAQLQVDYVRRGALRPSAGVRALALEAGPLQLGARAFVGRVFPTARANLIVPTWDLQASLRADLTLRPFCLVVETGALLETNFRAENTAAYGLHLAGLDAELAGPLWLTARGGVIQHVDRLVKVAWAGFGLRW